MNFILQSWTKKDYQNYVKYLESIKETSYKDFSESLTFSKYPMLGIRIPKLRSIAKEIAKGNALDFLESTKHKYFEEVMIKGFVIAYSNSEDIFDEFFYEFLDEIDNWSICDSFCNSIKIVRGKDKYFKEFKRLAKSKNEYYVRVALISILNHFINDKYIDDIFDILDNIKIDTYYVNMASAWLLCECFIKQRDKTLIYLNRSKLNNFAFNKMISKCIDSYRVSDEDKKYLRSIKRKEVNL